MSRSCCLYAFLLFLMGCFSQSVQAQKIITKNLSISEYPSDYQVYQRNESDNCFITIKGRYTSTIPLLLARKLRHGYSDKHVQISSVPIPINPDSTFEVKFQVPAELQEWSLSLYIGAQKLVEFKDLVCGDVYAVLGQSNATADLGPPESAPEMNGQTFNADYSDRYARAVGQGLWGLETSQPQEKWKSWGPAGALYYNEYHSGGWPLKLQNDLIKNYKVPVGIINAAFSGSEIASHFKDAPPIQPQYQEDGVPLFLNPEKLNVYGYFMSKLERAGTRKSLKYIFWYQGEADVALSGCTDYYYNQLELLKQEWEDMLPSLESVFLFQLNTSCLSEMVPHGFKIREAQRQFCQVKDDVYLIPTSGVKASFMSSDETHLSGLNQPCHYNRHGMEFLAEKAFVLTSKLIYNSQGLSDQQAFANNPLSAELDDGALSLRLEFEYPVRVDQFDDSPGEVSLKDYFFDQAYNPIPIDSYSLQGHAVILKLREQVHLDKLSFLPATLYHNSQRTYYGPWLMTEASALGVPFFADFPVSHTDPHEASFQSEWNNGATGRFGNIIVAPSDQIVTGNFCGDKRSEVLIAKGDGSVTLCRFANGGWHTLREFSTGLPLNAKTIEIGDFDGDKIHELLVDQKIFRIDSTNGIAPIFSLMENKSQSTVALPHLVADFNGNGREELLVFDQPHLKMTLYSFTDMDSNANPQSIPLNSHHEDLFWEYTDALQAGDFDGDGTDELLAYGQGTRLLKLVDSHWKTAWQASLFNHFSGFDYPLHAEGLQFFSADFYPAHPGEELLFLDEGRKNDAVGILGFDSEENYWAKSVAELQAGPFLGDWPLNLTYGRNAWYLPYLTSEGSLILALRQLPCGNEWLLSAALYSVNTPLSTLGKPKIPLQKNSFNLYPNPTNQLLRVECPFVLLEPTHLKVLNVQGQVVIEKRFTSNPNNFIISTIHLPEGVYLFQLNSGSLTETHKLMVTH